MNLKIWKGKEKAAKEPEGTVFLKLVEYELGDEIKVVVRAVDRFGEEVFAPNLVGFTDDGRLLRFPGVNPDLDFELNKRGQIKQRKDLY